MVIHHCLLNRIVAAILAIVMFSLPLGASADDARLTRLFAELIEADEADSHKIAGEIELEWSKSGSAAMDLLLKRGIDALEAGDSQAAIGHLTALTDHAPDFAEGWHMRAVAMAQAELYGPAAEDVERALMLEPRHYNAIASLGGILIETERYDLAKRAFEQVLAIHPYHKDVSETLDYLESLIGGAEL